MSNTNILITNFTASIVIAFLLFLLTSSKVNSNTKSHVITSIINLINASFVRTFSQGNAATQWITDHSQNTTLLATSYCCWVCTLRSHFCPDGHHFHCQCYSIDWFNLCLTAKTLCSLLERVMNRIANLFTFIYQLFWYNARSGMVAILLEVTRHSEIIVFWLRLSLCWPSLEV